jgi:hypothetical protein
MGYLRFPLGRAEVSMEYATHHARRSMPEGDIRDDDRKYHDEGMVLLPLFGRRQRAVRLHCRASVCICKYFGALTPHLETESTC